MAWLTRAMREMTKDEQRRFAAFAVDKFEQLARAPARMREDGGTLTISIERGTTEPTSPLAPNGPTARLRAE